MVQIFLHHAIFALLLVFPFAYMPFIPHLQFVSAASLSGIAFPLPA